MPSYIFRPYMAYDVRPSDDWSTVLEYRIDAEVDSADVEATSDAIVVGLQQILLNNVIIDRVTISTWEPDSEPYDPLALRSISYGVAGTRAFVLTNPVADDLALFIRKDVSSGRNGKMQLRGTLTVADITSESGAWVIEPTELAEYTTNISEMYTNFQAINTPLLIGVVLLDTTYPAVSAGQKQIPVKVYSTNPNVRPVSGLTLVGPRPRQVSQ